MLTAALILIATYIGVAFTILPKVNVDRPSAAFTGAILMVLFGVLTFQKLDRIRIYARTASIRVC